MAELCLPRTLLEAVQLADIDAQFRPEENADAILAKAALTFIGGSLYSRAPAWVDNAPVTAAIDDFAHRIEAASQERIPRLIHETRLQAIHSGANRHAAVAQRLIDLITIEIGGIRLGAHGNREVLGFFQKFLDQIQGIVA